MKILVIGAGLAGLTAARHLQSHGVEVEVFDKGRGAGGRMATRRIGSQRFDHGAQYFSALSPRFQNAVNRWMAAGVAEEWFTVDGQPRYRGVEGMNAIAKHWAEGLNVRLSAKVTGVERSGGKWSLRTENGDSAQGDALLITAPVPQGLELVGSVLPSVPRHLASIRYAPCFALMAVLDGESGLAGKGFVRLPGGPLSWVADNTRKGITAGGGALTIHATPEFTQQHYDDPPEQVAALLLEAVQPWLGGTGVREWQLHRWRYSLATSPAPEPCCVLKAPGPLAFAGDGFGIPRMEGAFLSGCAAALALLEM